MTVIMNWIKQHIKSRLFHNLFGMIFLATLIPAALLVLSTRANNGSMIARVYPEIIWVILLAALLAILVAIYLMRYITNPIAEFTKSATEIARGNFSHRVSLTSDDELGRLARLFNYMTTELRRLDNMNLAKIIAERNKTQTIIRNIADGVIVTDPKSKILILNSSAERWFNINESKVVDLPISDIIQEPKLLQLVAQASTRAKTPLPSVEITTKVTGEWKPRILQAKAARVQQNDGTLIGIVTILRDITQQKEIDRMKTELVSMVAHELRSPLTSISGFSELLLDEDTTREQSSEYAGIILKEANRLSDLINKFLDISRIESGRIQPKKSQVDLIETLQMVVGNNSYLAQRKQIMVEVHTPDELPPVYADHGMMEQVFVNLFTNAIKYSPEKTRIDILVKETDDSVVTHFHDQGYGIPKEALVKIFEKFYRVADRDETREAQGTGLGLPLVKQIVEMHGGKISVKSQINKGSVFSVYLPKMNYQNKSHAFIEQDSEDLIR